MNFPFRRILCPIDFDDNSLAALDVASKLALQLDSTLYVLHVVPMIIPPTGMPVYVDLQKGQDEAARNKLNEVARKHLAGIKYELQTLTGDPAGSILKSQRSVAADLIVMSTHGRRGFARFLLGSVAELVLREANCPVLTIRQTVADKNLVGTWMSAHPVTAAPDEKLASVHAKMSDGGFRSMPVVKAGQVLGVITDRDVRRHEGALENTAVKQAMSDQIVTVTPATSIHEAARLLRELKMGGLPVLEGNELVGVITTTDILGALTEQS
jgi:nucleotide-binding universal stress UspA family protein/predicted transcriptional regulator